MRARRVRFRYPVRTLLIAVAIFACAFASLRIARSFRSEVEMNAWVGVDRSEVLRALGPPDESYAGEVSPDNAYRRSPASDEIPQTDYYRTPLGHLFISFAKVNGRWVCYRSLWHREGVIF